MTNEGFEPGSSRSNTLTTTPSWLSTQSWLSKYHFLFSDPVLLLRLERVGPVSQPTNKQCSLCYVFKAKPHALAPLLEQALFTGTCFTSMLLWKHPQLRTSGLLSQMSRFMLCVATTKKGSPNINEWAEWDGGRWNRMDQGWKMECWRCVPAQAIRTGMLSPSEPLDSPPLSQ